MKNKVFFTIVDEREVIFLGQNNFQKFSSQDQDMIFVDTVKKCKEIALKNYIENPKNNYIGFVIKFVKEENEIKGKIKLIDVFFGNKFKNFTDESIIDYIEDEMRFYRVRLEKFLETKSRKIIDDDYFIKLNKDFETYVIESSGLNTEDFIKYETQKYNSKKEKIALTNTIDEAIEFLIQDCGAEKINEIKNETVLTQFIAERNHFGFNMYFRNLFFYGDQNENFIKAIEEYGKISFANRGEFGEGYLADAFWRKLNNCEINPEIQQKLKNAYEETDLLTRNYCKGKGVENVNDLNAEDFNGLFKIYKNNKEKEGSDNLTLRLKLQSYNIIDEDINKYITLENNNNDRKVIKYQRYAILAGVKENEKKIYESLKQDYFRYYAIYKKLDSFIRKIKEQRIINDL